MRFLTLLPVLVLSFGLSAAPAHADELLFTLTDGTNTISFTSGTPPVVAGTVVDTVYDPGTVYGFYITANVDTDGTSTPDYVAFYDSAYGGGIAISSETSDAVVLNQYNPVTYDQYFGGTVENPTFSPLTSNPMVSYNFGDSPVYEGSFTLAVTEVTPEPSSLVLLGTGMLGVLGGVRRRLR